MDKKMIGAWKSMQAAYKQMESMMNGGELEEEMQEPDTEMKTSEMPDQSMDAEEGDYSGKGMMADQEKKKALLKAAMKGKY